MKVLFIFKNENFLAPIGLCAISAAAKKAGHQTYLCDMNSQNPLECITRLNPDVIAYSSSSGEAKHYLRLNKAIKEKFPQLVTIMGGPHPTFYPGVVEAGGLDAVCIGEGEGVFEDVLSALTTGNSLNGIPNVVTSNNKDSFTVRPLVEELDSLPFPDYALLYDNTPLGKYPLKSIITSRGCPYECTYCFNSAWRKIYTGKGKPVRRHSVEYVLDEIRFVKKNWSLGFIKFYDDIFSYSPDGWLEEFSKRYKEEVDLPFFILTRADLLTEDMVKLLKYAGCHTISMSIEAGNEDVRNRLLKRRMSDEQIINAHRLCDTYGIHTFTNCMVGLPSTDTSSDIEAIDLAIKAKVTWAEFPIFYPYPGTELGEHVTRLGLYSPNYDQMHTSYQYKSVLNCFSERQKNVQMNLSVLGSVAVVFPPFKDAIVRYAIYLRHNIMFTFIYYLAKMYILRRKIYVTKTTFRNSVCIFVRSLRQEWFRHEHKSG